MSSAARFDWPAAYQRLSGVLAKLDAAEHPTGEDTRRTLRARAIQYAKPVNSDSDQRYIEVIVFEVDGDRFAVDVDSGGAAMSLAGMTAIPGVPSFYLGLVSHRGSIFPVVDVRPLLGASKSDRKSLRYAVLVRNDHGALGLAAAEILGITRYRSNQIASVMDETTRERALIGIGPNSTMIIDVGHLLQDVRLLVDDQPSISARNGGDRS